MPKTRVIPCTKEEMDALIEATIEDDFYHLLFSVARRTGRRLGEYYDVQVKDINFDEGIMMTKVLKRRKKVEREAVLTPDIIFLLKRYIRKHKLKLDDYVFRKVSYRQIQNRIHSFAKKAKIPHKVTFHNFRHYFVTELSRKGWAYEKIIKLTGHGSIGSLQVYDSVVASDVAQDARRDVADI